MSTSSVDQSPDALNGDFELPWLPVPMMQVTQPLANQFSSADVSLRFGTEVHLRNDQHEGQLRYQHSPDQLPAAIPERPANLRSILNSLREWQDNEDAARPQPSYPDARIRTLRDQDQA